MEKDAKIYISGHSGMVGSAIVRKLKLEGYINLLTASHKELDLTRQNEVEAFFENERPDYVFLSAAKVRGIMANNTHPASFFYDNIMIAANIIHSAKQYETKKLLFLGSSCIYPRFAKQPIKEEALLTGELEPTNEGYALAKIAGLKMCEYYNRQYKTNFISVMPCNIYGPNDNYDLNHSHVLPALIRRFHEAKENRQPSVTIWGSGKQYREFLYVDDLADACLYLMNHYSDNQFVNIGMGEDQTIAELAETIKEIVGYEGEIIYDTTKPDGMHRKVVDTTKLNAANWHYKTPLKEGIRLTYQDFLKGNYREQ